MKLTIPLPPVTKKNHQEIRKNWKTGKSFVSQSDVYKQYETDCCWAIPGKCKKRIDFPVNVKALYYMKTRGKVDLNNLHSALHDVLVKAGVLEDDNCRIIVSTDGSRVLYDKDNPRTEVKIAAVEE